MIQLLHYRKLPVLTLFFALLFMGGTAMGQKTWIGGAAGTWSTGSNWDPTGVPGATDEVIFSNGGSISVTGVPTTTIRALTVSGNTNVTLESVNSGGASTISLSNSTVGTNALTIEAGSTLRLQGATGGSRNLTLRYNAAASSIGEIAGNLVVDENSNLGIFNTANSTTTVTGVITNTGGSVASTAATLTFASGGQYLHQFNGGTIPTATWNAASTANITGIVGIAPGGLAQTFGNVTWDCNGQTANISFAPTSIAGNLNVFRTGTGQLQLGATPRAVAGNFVVGGGTFRIGSGNTLNVSGATTISGTGTLLLNDGAGVGTLSLAGNFTQSGGTITETGAGSGSIVFAGSTAQVFDATLAGGTVANEVNYTVNSGAILQMLNASSVARGDLFTVAAGGTLGIRSTGGLNTAPNAVGNVQTTSRSFSPAGNYIYNGTAAQTTGDGIPTALTGTLTINNVAGVTLSGAESIGNGGTVFLQSGGFATGTNLTLNSTANIRRGNGSITGTFQGTGDYNVEYTVLNAAGAELQGGQGLENRLNNLTINLATSNSFVSLNTETRVKGVLTLTNGKLVTTSTNILVMTATATTPGGSPLSYVSGPVRKLGTSAFVFPIGSGLETDYRPMAVSGSGTSISAALSASAEINATVSLANPLKIFNRVFLPDLLSLTNCLWWNIQRTDAGVNNVFIWLSTGNAGASQTVNFVSGCFGGTAPPPTPSLLRVAHYVSNQWQSLGNSAQVQTANAWFIGAGTGIASFSPFTVGSAEGVLPVTFTSFTGLKDGNSVKLAWETSSEQNSAYFDVERSSDGVNYSSIGKVNAAGNSATVRKYGFTDNNPATGRNFYRLRQVDLDGQFEYSKTISVNMAANAAVSIYPNPVLSNVMVEYPKVGKGAIYKVLSVDGRVMQSGALQENSSQQNINLGNLQRGNYILVIQNDGQQYVQKIMKQ